MHLVYGGLQVFGMLIGLLVMLPLVLSGAMMGPRPGPAPAIFFIIMAAVMLFFAVLFAIPPLISGYALLKRKRRAKLAGIITACITALGIPMGTALSVYTFWFLLGETGKQFYADPSGLGTSAGRRATLGSAPPPPPDWNARPSSFKEREPAEYVPPSEPPDWRG